MRGLFIASLCQMLIGGVIHFFSFNDPDHGEAFGSGVFFAGCLLGAMTAVGYVVST